MIALSTMWGVGQEAPLVEALREARAAGYQAFELNHQLPPDVLKALGPRELEITSVHDPCPRSIPAYQEVEEGVALTSLDEGTRRRAVALTLESLKTAVRYGGRMVVLHLGSVEELEAADRELVRVHREEGRSPHHEWRLRNLVNGRRPLAPPRVEAGLRSLEELEPLARGLGVGLALETRAYLHEIPSLPEAIDILSHLPDDLFYYWHDTGHAHRLQSHGLSSQADWLGSLGSRLGGVHLHDCRGMEDHLLPGEGEVDFGLVARYLPARAIRVAELRPEYTPAQIKQARLRFEASGL